MSGAFGPWAPDIDPAERLARLGAMRALAMTVARPHAGELIRALRRAEDEPAALPEALVLLDRSPALARRRVLATYAALAKLR